jgi:membrane associated rhomboid family serine protease
MKDITKQDKGKAAYNGERSGPLLFISLLWLVYFIEYAMNIDLFPLGIFPRDPSSLPGIFFTPFLHGSLGHLLSNSIPLLVLGSGLIYFYRNIAYRVFLWIWLIDGLGVWLPWKGSLSHWRQRTCLRGSELSHIQWYPA